MLHKSTEKTVQHLFPNTWRILSFNDILTSAYFHHLQVEVPYLYILFALRYTCTYVPYRTLVSFTKAYTYFPFSRLHEIWKMSKYHGRRLDRFDMQLCVTVLSCTCHSDTFAMHLPKEHLTHGHKCTRRGICGTWTCYPSAGHVAPGYINGVVRYSVCVCQLAFANGILFSARLVQVLKLCFVCCHFFAIWIQRQVLNVCFDWCGTDCSAG